MAPKRHCHLVKSRHRPNRGSQRCIMHHDGWTECCSYYTPVIHWELFIQAVGVSGLHGTEGMCGCWCLFNPCVTCLGRHSPRLKTSA